MGSRLARVSEGRRVQGTTDLPWMMSLRRVPVLDQSSPAAMIAG
jgi:hypothetical protein